MFTRRVLGGLAAAVFLRAPIASAAGAEVSIDNFTFAPDILKVNAGTAVKFTNRDDLPHSVVSARTPPAFKSKVLDTEDSFTFTFDKPGEYVYFCGLHPHMKGVVVVA